VKPADTGPVDATGIEYLRLLEAAHLREVRRTINYDALGRRKPQWPGVLRIR
jgi:hypothetical protein